MLAHSIRVPMAVELVRRPVCELCGHDDPVQVFRRPLVHPSVWEFLERYYEGRIRSGDVDGGVYEISKCPACGFLWQANVLPAREMTLLYNTWISAEQSLRHKREAPVSFFARHARQIEEIAMLVGKDPHDCSLLDFGMGWGYWCRMAAAFGYRVQGIEVAADRIRHARGLGVDVVDGLSRVPVGTYDFINADQVLEHVPNPVPVMRELARVLRRKGVARIAVPNASQIEARFRAAGWRAAHDAAHPLEHVNCFLPSTLRRLGEVAGLETMTYEGPEGRGSPLRRSVRRLRRLLGRAPQKTVAYFQKP